MAKKATQVATAQRPFAKRLLSLCDSGRHSAWAVWEDFVVMFACAISNRFDMQHYDKREQLYLNHVKHYTREELEVFPALIADLVMALDEKPFQDYLGSVYMELELGNDRAGQFFTPYDICVCMAKISTADCAARIMDEGYISVNDCACGAGATLIAACEVIHEQLSLVSAQNWQHHVLVFAQDLDYIVALMCYIQLSLIGAAAVIKIGDSLSDPMRADDDNKDNYWYTPMYYHPVWRNRRLIQRLERARI